MKKTILFLATVLFIFVNTHAQSEMWIKNSPEIRLNFKNNPIEIRWRPIDQMIMPPDYFGKKSYIRTDLMLGVNVWKFKIFNYSKYDEFNNFWTGARMDLNLDFLNHKYLVNIQGRYFWGINAQAAEHYYHVIYQRYKLSNNICLGILSYGKIITEKGFSQSEWFIGPSFVYNFTPEFNFMTVLASNVLNTHISMFFVRLGYKFSL